MAHQPAIRPDLSSFDPPDEPRNIAEPVPPPEEDPSQVLAELARTLAQNGGGNASADLALDLVLNEIVQQACLATTATGAAVALLQDDDLVVRATTGLNAPELGVRLSMHAGLSGACMQTGLIQRCADTQSDHRIDAATCTELQIFSILAIPILQASSVVGILEIFSNRPHAFSDRDEQTLQALSRRIVSTITSQEVNAEVVNQETGAGVEEEFESDPVAPENPIPAVTQRRSIARSRDYLTPALTFSVIALALLLGWMIGLPYWQQHNQVSPASSAASPPSNASQATSELATVVPAESRRTPTAAQKKISAKAEEAPVQPGLVVYDKGRIVYESTSPKPAVSTPKLSSAIAGGLLMSKVEPEYPEQAKVQQLEGPVVLNIVVGTDGLVGDVKVASGKPELADAAVSAVRQWRFRPYTPSGTPTSFQTRVTVKFSLSGDGR